MVNYSVLRTQYEKNYNYGAQRSSLNVVFTCESYNARCWHLKIDISQTELENSFLNPFSYD